MILSDKRLDERLDEFELRLARLEKWLGGRPLRTVPASYSPMPASGGGTERRHRGRSA